LSDYYNIKKPLHSIAIEKALLETTPFWVIQLYHLFQLLLQFCN